MKGVSAAYAWIIVLLFVFVISFLWIIFSQVMVPYVFPEAKAALAGYPDSLTVVDNIETMWNNWPLIALFLMVVFGLVSSLRRQPDTYSSGWYG